MSASSKPVAVLDHPVIRTLAEAIAHDPDTPALVTVPGHLVRPLILMLRALKHATPEGKFAHAIELQLAGLAGPESGLIRAGVAKAAAVVSQISRSPEQVLAEVVSAEAAHPRTENTGRLEGGWRELVVPMGDGEDEAPLSLVLDMTRDGASSSPKSTDADPVDSTTPEFIRTREDLLAHPRNQPALMIIPAELIAGAWWLVEHRTDADNVGECARGLELCLAGWGELVFGEPYAAQLILQGMQQAANACNRMVEGARELRVLGGLEAVGGGEDEGGGKYRH